MFIILRTSLYRGTLYWGSTVPLIHLRQKICKCGEIHLPPYMAQGVYSRFQVTGVMEWGQKSKHKKILWASNNSQKKFLDQTLTPKNAHAKFPSLTNFQKALNDWHEKCSFYQVCLYFICRIRWPGYASTTLFWIPPKIPTYIVN